MMKKLVALVVLASLTFMTGCFTTFGGVAGAKHKDPATGENHALRGALVGAVLDAVIIGVLLSKADWYNATPDNN